MEPVSFETHASRYRHWRAEYDGPIARLYMDVAADRPLREGYALKLNSYDLGVDIELADFIRRLRFEHPEVNTLLVTSANPKIFCAGANIQMLGSSSHAWKVNFCKFTNETRCELEDLGATSGVCTLAALNGPCAGGGYELAMACDEIWLVDDGNSTVSLPETPLLGVLPGTGGLTRLVDKRRVRRDRADVFCTLAEGVRGQRALDWRLVDGMAPRSRFQDRVDARLAALAAPPEAGADRSTRVGIALGPLDCRASRNQRRYSSVRIGFDAAGRAADLVLCGPDADLPDRPQSIREQGDHFWPLRWARELDDALLDLRANHPEVGLVRVHTEGDLRAVLAADQILYEQRDDWFVGEVVGLIARTLQRLERSACSFFALIEPGSCFGGSFLDVALGCDRSYMLDEPGVEVALSPLNAGSLPMTNGLGRLACRLLGEPDLLARVEGDHGCRDAAAALEAGLVTEILDDLDFEDSVRIACEERLSLNPDALTGMEANLRFAGPENLRTKVFGRLTAWQNWIFNRPNATGPRGALTLYGKPERPAFDWKRV